MGKKPPHPDRERTDESLSAERQKTDEEVAKRRSEVQEDADAVVSKTRQRADDVLERDRERADASRGGPAEGDASDETVSKERAREDNAIARERAMADEKLGEEREARDEALAALFRFEREATDKYLLTERDSSDVALASRDSFLGMVSHDLRTLLGGIALQAALLERNAPPEPYGEAVRQRAEAIQRFTARMNRLIGDLVDVASIEAGKLAVTPQPQEATRLMRETMEAFGPTAAAKGLSLEAEVAHGSLLAKFDRERVLQVLGNLVSNAIKFTPEGGRISLRVEPADGEVRFCVKDTGPGVAERNSQVIFERFKQADDLDRRGLGLGLYISRCIVEAHGGRIWVESKPGKGSTFFFTLPAG